MFDLFLLLITLGFTNFVSASNLAPGTILSHKGQPLTIFNNYKQSWLIEVASENSFGNYNTIPAIIIEPQNANKSRVVAYQTPEDAANITCAPSTNIVNGNFSDTLAINLLLRQGYYVIVTDYEGPELSFLAGKQSGQAVLNAIRATLDSESFTGINPDAQVILFGYSGGSFASGWAAVLQPTYAPELKLTAAALGGFLTDLSTTIQSLDGGFWAGFVALGLGGLENEYPELSTYLRNNSQSTRLSEFQQYCTSDALSKFQWVQFFSGPFKIFSKDWNSMPSNDTLKKILVENSITNYNHTPNIPIFIFQGSLDLIVPITNSKEIYDKWCKLNIESLEFAEDLTAGHGTEGLFGIPAAFTWMGKRFNGEPPVQGCVHDKRLNNLLYPGIDPFILQLVQDQINQIFGGLGQGITQDKPSSQDLQAYISRTNGTGL